MKIIEPNVELWTPADNVSHVARCARICYRKETGNDDALYNSLIKRNHLSMFRHETSYYIVPIKYVPNWAYAMDRAKEMGAMIVGIDICNTKFKYYIVANGQWCIEHPKHIDCIKSFEVSEKEFKDDSEIAWNMMRYTFKVTTQISTSRELNRVSPNNIAEQSTRYVYEDGTICRPWWLIQELIAWGKDYLTNDYLTSCENAFETYKHLIDDYRMIRQDARGVLPLDTATVCAYTYSVREYRAILDLRYYGTTGQPHPNAKLIAGMIREQLMELGYDFR